MADQKMHKFSRSEVAYFDEFSPTPPHNDHLEQAVLGAILINNEAYSRIVGLIDASHFFYPLHGQIFQACADLIEGGNLADAVTLKHIFANVEVIPLQLTASQYLGTLAASAATTQSVVKYASGIRVLASRRMIISACKAAATRAYVMQDSSPSALIEDIRVELKSIAQGLEESPPYYSRCLEDVTPQPIQWLWPDRIALGKLSLIAGEPGLGKSQLVVALAATLTNGGRWPDGSAAPTGSVVFICCEDDASDTIRPRLEAANAQLSGTIILDGVRKRGRDSSFDIVGGVSALAELVDRVGDVKLIVIDPISAYMGSADSHKNSDVRAAFTPLQVLAASKGVAIVVVTHLNKTRDASAMSRVGGSGAFVAVCRSAWLVARDPNDPTKTRRVLAPIKNNLGDDRTGFEFTVEPVQLSNGLHTSRVEFGTQPITIDVDELLNSRAEGTEIVRPIDEACDFLRDLLTPGSRPTADVLRTAKEAGISKRTLDRARQTVGVRSSRKEGHWHLSLKTCDTESAER